MRSESATFLSLISGPRVLEVPPFQRQYSWGKEERETLWLDILAQYEVLKAHWHQPEEERNTALENRSLHYLGTIVLDGPSMLGTPKSSIIDGQQRITTLLLAMAAVRDGTINAERNGKRGALSADAKTRAQAVKGRFNDLYLINVHAEDEAKRRRLLPLPADKRAFNTVIDHDGLTRLTKSALALTPAESSLSLEAYQFFLTELGRQAVDGSRSPGLVRFAKLFPLDLKIVEEVLARRLAVIQIETKNVDDVNAIFESLNAKGRDLTQLDLLRNYIFMKLGATRGVQVMNDEWTPMQNNLGFGGIEALAWADLVARGQYTLQKRLYKTAQLDLQSQDKPAADAALEYVSTLRRKAVWWKTIINPDDEPDVETRRALSRLRRGGGYHRPIRAVPPHEVQRSRMHTRAAPSVLPARRIVRHASIPMRISAQQPQLNVWIDAFAPTRPTESAPPNRRRRSRRRARPHGRSGRMAER